MSLYHFYFTIASRKHDLPTAFELAATRFREVYHPFLLILF
ncbi:hypothetical protein D1AOALGA4SA_9005 [Olavius algarvensis Delta 1 endosymbiont]|nr:hypothetical protein D1AOALGA4SA_9005 [Olavius algarvensis Delta 1 endosymbiont]